MNKPLDDETLTLLVAICDLTGQKHSVKHIAAMYERYRKEVEDYRRKESESDTPYRHS
jgi:hypothetical protein